MKQITITFREAHERIQNAIATGKIKRGKIRDRLMQAIRNREKFVVGTSKKISWPHISWLSITVSQAEFDVMFSDLADGCILVDEVASS